MNELVDHDYVSGGHIRKADFRVSTPWLGDFGLEYGTLLNLEDTRPVDESQDKVRPIRLASVAPMVADGSCLLYIFLHHENMERYLQYEKNEHNGSFKDERVTEQLKEEALQLRQLSDSH